MNKSRSEIAAEITIAALQPGGNSEYRGAFSKADEVANFYEVIFKKLIEMDKQERQLLDS